MRDCIYDKDSFYDMEHDSEVIGFDLDFEYDVLEVELTEEEMKAYKLDELRCKLFNEFIDIAEMIHDDKKITEKQFEKYIRLSSYFSEFPQEKKSEWIDIGIMVKYSN